MLPLCGDLSAHTNFDNKVQSKFITVAGQANALNSRLYKDNVNIRKIRPVFGTSTVSEVAWGQR